MSSDTRTTASAGGAAADALDQRRFPPGAVVAGRYRVVALLGRAGMGEVYRAQDLKLRQPVALKFLPSHLQSDPGRLARFHRAWYGRPTTAVVLVSAAMALYGFIVSLGGRSPFGEGAPED